MTVSTQVKAHRRALQAQLCQREYERTGRNAYEQFLASSAADVAEIHRKINRRVEKARETIPWRPNLPRRVYRDRGLV